MLEMKITITAQDLAAAINNLATAIANGGSTNIANTGTVNFDMPAAPVTTAPVPTAPAAPVAASVNPTQPVAPTGAPQNVGTAPTQLAPTTTAPAEPAHSNAPTGTPTYTLEMIATAGTALIDAGKMDQLLALLGKYGVEALTALNPSQYGAFATELRALGAKI